MSCHQPPTTYHLLLFAAALLAAGCGRPARPVSRTWLAMDTLVSVSVPAADAAHLPPLADAARTTLERLEGALSLFKPASDMARLNRAAGTGSVEVAADTLRVLRLSVDYAGRSDGCFDVTVGPLMGLWGFRDPAPPARVPDVTAVTAARALVGWRRLAIEGRTARLEEPGMGVDLGGLAKGYAADVCFEQLRALGGSNLLVNLGGNMRAAGRARPGASWKIGVRNPFDRDDLLGTLGLTDGLAVATSGSYERFVTIGGRRYSHIMDPRSGRPVEGMAGVTILSTTATEADALSTALFVAGLDGAGAILARCPTAEALLIPDRQPLELHVTPGFRARFTCDPRYADAIRFCTTILKADTTQRLAAVRTGPRDQPAAYPRRVASSRGR